MQKFNASSSHTVVLRSGTTTILTTTFLALETRNDLPKVSYLTALDYFVSITFVFIFGTIAQFAIVHYFTKVGSGEYYFSFDTPVQLAPVESEDEDDDDRPRGRFLYHQPRQDAMEMLSPPEVHGEHSNEQYVHDNNDAYEDFETDEDALSDDVCDYGSKGELYCPLHVSRSIARVSLELCDSSSARFAL